VSAKQAKAKILYIEGERADRPSFAFGLEKKGYQVERVNRGSSAASRLDESLPDLVIIDTTSMRTSGRRIFQNLKKQAVNIPIVIIVDQNVELRDKSGADVVLAMPFPLQKLGNRIRPLLPVEEKNILQVGPFQLDIQQRVARCQNKQARLTPRLVALLRILMEHPGVAIERESLFRQVWDTAYTGDTRTLDVHVSWLRQALEKDPRQPQFIKTVRGLGYRLDIDSYLPADEDNSEPA
jgi:DNA-binding response OmpR family regulator